MRLTVRISTDVSSPQYKNKSFYIRLNENVLFLLPILFVLTGCKKNEQIYNDEIFLDQEIIEAPKEGGDYSIKILTNKSPETLSLWGEEIVRLSENRDTLWTEWVDAVVRTEDSLRIDVTVHDNESMVDRDYYLWVWGQNNFNIVHIQQAAF